MKPVSYPSQGNRSFREGQGWDTAHNNSLIRFKSNNLSRCIRNIHNNQCNLSTSSAQHIWRQVPSRDSTETNNNNKDISVRAASPNLSNHPPPTNHPHPASPKPRNSSAPPPKTPSSTTNPCKHPTACNPHPNNSSTPRNQTSSCNPCRRVALRGIWGCTSSRGRNWIRCWRRNRGGFLRARRCSRGCFMGGGGRGLGLGRGSRWGRADNRWDLGASRWGREGSRGYQDSRACQGGRIWERDLTLANVDRSFVFCCVFFNP